MNNYFAANEITMDFINIWIFLKSCLNDANLRYITSFKFINGAFYFRLLWKKYKKRRECIEYDGVLHTEECGESLSRPLHSHLLNSEKVSLIVEEKFVQ